MSDLEWRETAGGYESGAYRIDPDPSRFPAGWCLEVAPAGDVTGAVETSRHRTLADAMTRAGTIERERFRRARVRGHAVVGSVSLFLFMLLMPAVRSLETFAAAMVVLWIALRSLSNSLGVALGDAWQWAQDGGAPDRVTRTDRLVVALMDRLRRMQRAAIEPETPEAVQVVHRI
jgi:hypothetical protein